MEWALEGVGILQNKKDFTYQMIHILFFSEKFCIFSTVIGTVTFTMLRADSADKLMIFFLFFLENSI